MRSFECLYCKTIFQTDRKRIYCSKTCRIRADSRRRYIKSDRNDDNRTYSMRNPERYRAKVTPKNVKLYCKLSEIIRDKTCVNPNTVLAKQDRGRWKMQTFP